MKPKTAARPTSPTSPTTRPPTPAEDSVPALEGVRAEAAATNAQLQAMQALTDTALSHLALDDLLRELLGRVTAVLGVDTVSISLLDADGRTLTLRAARGIPMGQGFFGRVTASRAPLIADADALSDADFEGLHPILRERLRTVAGVPLLVVDQEGDHLVSRLVGVLGVGSAAPRRFTEADVQLLQRAADRIALAVDRARLYAAEQDARQRAQASEAEAAERAEHLRTILEAMADGVAVYDTQGRPLYINRAYRELFALERAPAGFETLTHLERARLLHLRDAATGAPLPFGDTPAGRALRGEVVTGPRADVRARAFDGRELEVNVSGAPLRDREGHLVGVVCVLHDQTERNRLAREREVARTNELAAREASRRLEAFLATAAHDLRTPLAAAVGYLDLAQRQAERLVDAVQEESPELVARVDAVRGRLDDAAEGTERLTRLLNLLFDTAALRADKLELHRAPADLAALVHAQVAALRVAAPDRTIRLHAPAGRASGAGGSIPVAVDADRIGQVVTNYLTNALKYSPPDRPVDVAVEARQGRARMARVAVCDQGPGIPKAEQARVWESFHRAPEVTVQGGAPGGTQNGSLGLGLHISKAIVQAHGGRVGVKSTVGHGSTFWFTLPLSGLMPGRDGVAP